MHKYLGILITLIALPILITLANPAIALLVGMSLTLIINRAPVDEGQTYGKYLLQTAIIFLGLKLQISDLLRISADYTWLVAAYVMIAALMGLGLAKALKLEKNNGILMSSGTAICGGTAIATLAPIIRARPDQVGVALAIVFLLNAAALFTFPAIGHYFSLTQEQFGVWVAISIHDTSSVVATAQIYGEEAAKIATTVKLGRTLWLIPLVLIMSFIMGTDNGKIRLPIFIILFILASISGSLLPIPQLILDVAAWGSKALLVCALYFIGTGITRDTLKQLQGKVLAHAILLWAIVVPSTLMVVLLLVQP